MAHDIRVEQTDETQVLGVLFEATAETIGDEVGKAYERLFGTLATEGIAPTGPPRLVYHGMEDDRWTVQACIPVPDGTPAPEGLRASRMGGVRAVTTVHTGPYQEIGDAYHEMEAWMDEHDVQPAGAPYDVYLNDPNEVQDPKQLQTQIVWPVG